MLAYRGTAMALGPPPLQRQTFLGVEPIDALVVHQPAFALEQRVRRPMPGPNPHPRELADPTAQRGLRRPHRLIPQRRARHPDRATRAPFRQLVCGACPPGQRAPLRRPHHSFSQRLLQDGLVQAQISDQALEFLVLLAQLPQFPDLGDVPSCRSASSSDRSWPR